MAEAAQIFSQLELDKTLLVELAELNKQVLSTNIPSPASFKSKDCYRLHSHMCELQ